MISLWKTILLLLVPLLALTGQLSARSFWVNYSPEVAVGDALCYDVSILAAETKADINQINVRGGKCIGYLSLIEVPAKATWISDLPAAGVKLLAENPSWKTKCADVSSQKWQDYVVNTLAKQLVNKGFQGFFLDTLDSVHFLKEAFPQRTAEFDAGIVTLIKNSSWVVKEVSSRIKALEPIRFSRV